MGLEDIFKNKTETDVRREIILELLDSEKNIDEKTELGTPLKWSALKVMNDFIKNQGLPISEEILRTFIKESFKLLISKDRKGRKEYIEALQAMGIENNEKENMKNMLGL